MMDLSRAIDIINNRRNLAELKVFELMGTLRKDKTFAACENKKSGLSFEIARREALNLDLGDLYSKYTESCACFEQLLADKGYSLKDLEPQYTCNLCNDTGFVEGKKCICLNNLIYDSLRFSCGRLETNIDSFDKVNHKVYLPEHKKGYMHTYTQLKKYADNFPYPKPFLLLIGGTGVGKSYMTSVLANVIMKKGFSVLFLNASEMNELFLRHHLADISLKGSIFAPLIECDLLVIDDLGCENTYKNVTINSFYNLIVNRYNKNTVITTNLSLNEIETRYEQRITSRLLDVNQTANFEVNGCDLRLIKRK